MSLNKVISTDPPYYDNIGYADLSDFFYVWLRRSLRSPSSRISLPRLAVPKAEELIATPYRHGSKEKAEVFFLDGMTAGLCITWPLNPYRPSLSPSTMPSSKADTKKGAVKLHSTGWETFWKRYCASRL